MLPIGINMDFGFNRFFQDIRHRRYRFRQFVGLAFVILVSIAGEPKENLFLAGTPLVLAGIAIRLWASGYVKKNSNLATDGPYSYVRHPQYVGNIILGFGFCLASGLWWSFPLFVAVILVFYPPAIRREDGRLHRLFQKEWEEWRERTRALLPRFSPYSPGSVGEWSLRQSIWTNGEPFFDLLLLFCLYLLFLRLS